MTSLAAAPAPTLPACSVLAESLTGLSAVSGMLPLQAEGANLVDEIGNRYRITGTSLGGFQSGLQPAGSWNYPYRTLTVAGVTHVGILDRLAAVGFNCIRLLICEDACWPGIKPLGYVNPTLNPDWYGDPNDPGTVIDGVAGLDLVIAHCGRLGLRVILDMHALAPDGNNNLATRGLWYSTASRLAASSTPVTHTAVDLRNEADWLGAWASIAQRYLGNPIVLGADLVNEPYAASWGDGNLETDIRAAYTRAANAIHAVNPDWLVFCEGIAATLNFGPADGGWVGTGWAAGLNLAGAFPVTPDLADRVVYSPHEYGPGIGKWNYFNTANFPANMPAVWNQMYGFLVRDNVAPVYVGELGDMMVVGAGAGAETPAIFAKAVKWLATAMRYYTGHTVTAGQRDVPVGVLGFSWSWFCWSTNGYNGTPGSIANTNLLMGDFDTVNSAILAYVTPHLAPPLLALVPVLVTLSLSQAAADPVSVGWTTQNGTALAGVHYHMTHGVATFAPGQTVASVSIPVLPLTAAKPGRLWFEVVLSAPGGCTIRVGQAVVSLDYC